MKVLSLDWNVNDVTKVTKGRTPGSRHLVMPTKRKVIPIKLLQCIVDLVENAEILITAEIQESKLPHVVSVFPIVVSLNRKICVRLIFCLLLAVSITVALVYFKR